MTHQERVSAVAALGFTERQADFLVHVMLHSGVCLGRQYCTFAGIARECEIKGEMTKCAVIITTSPNEIFREIHNSKQRQAVVIRKEDQEKWLDPKTKPDELKDLLKPLPESETHFNEV